jgi:hypothetical protein
VRRLRELDVAIADHLDVVPPRVLEAEPAACRPGREPFSPYTLSHRFLVVDDEPEVATAVGRLGSALLERDELVAQIDERHPGAPAAKLERPEDPLPERKRLLEVANLERDMVDPDRACHDSSLARSRRAAKVRPNITRYGDIRPAPPAELEDEMSAAEVWFVDENTLIEAWRAEELERAGYPAHDAAQIAARHDIDLHRAVDLLRGGCPLELALRIVL